MPLSGPAHRKPVLALALAAALLAPAGPARAGAWPAPEDGGGVVMDLLPTYSRVQGYNRYGLPAGRGWDSQLVGSLYWEHGVTERLTMGLQPRLQAEWLRNTGVTRDNYGWAETKVFARYAFYRGDWDAASVQVQVALPGVERRSDPRLAERNASYELRLLYGHSVPLGQVATAFGELSGSYEYRAGPNADIAEAKATFGVRPDEDWLIFAQLIGDMGMRNARPGGADYSVLRLRTSAVYTFSGGWGVELGYVHDIASRRLALGKALILGLW